MKSQIIKSMKFICSSILLSFICLFLIPQVAHAETLTGQVIIRGSMQPGAVIEAELIGTNNTGELSYSWIFDFGSFSVSYDRYYQKQYEIWPTDMGHFICCSVTSSAQSGSIESKTYYLEQGGSFDNIVIPTGQVPSSPSVVKAEPGDRKVTLTWNNCNGATSYGVFLYKSSTGKVTQLATTTAQKYVISNLTNGNTYQFVVRAKNAVGWSDWNSNQAVTVVPSGSSLSITRQPVDCTVNENGKADFSVSVASTSARYQWQWSTNGSDWTDLSNQTSSVFSFTASKNDNGKFYRCVVSDSSKTIYSNSARLNVNVTQLVINSHPSGVSVQEGGQASFSVTATGSNVTYQWQKSADNGRTWSDSSAAGNKSATLTFNAQYSDNNAQYRCVVSDVNGNRLTSNTAGLIVNMVYPYFSTNPSDVTVNAGETARFSVSVYGIGITYQWQKSADGGRNWTNVNGSGATSNSLAMSTTGYDNNTKVRCVATAANGQQIISNEATLYVNLPTPVVTGVGVTANGVQVTWDAVGGAAQYRVFYRAGSGSWVGGGNTTGTNKVVTGLTSGTTYTFTVRCVSADGATYTSNYDSKGKSITYIAMPQITEVSNASNGVQVKWNAVNGATQYRVFYKTGSGSWVGGGNTTGTSKVVTGLTSGTTYTFTVRCVSADGASYTSGYDATGKTISYKPVANTLLATPVLTGVSNTANGVQVNWNAVSGAAQYRVFYKTGNGSWNWGGNTTGTSKVVTGLTAGTTYVFTVRCLSADGNSYTSQFDATGKSITYQPTASTALAKPVISGLSNTANGVQVSWGAVNGAAKYRVFYRSGTGAWTTVGDVTGTSKEVTGLTSGTTYSFIVRCVSADGATYTSAYDVGYSKSVTYIGQPEITGVNNTADGVQVTWNPVSGAAKYRVFYKVGSGAWTTAADISGTSTVVKGLNAGTTYTFTVRCVSADGKNYTSNYDHTGKVITAK